MKISELIERLKEHHPDSVVEVYTESGEQLELIATYGRDTVFTIEVGPILEQSNEDWLDVLATDLKYRS